METLRYANCHIDLDNLCHNYRLLAEVAEISPVVKSDAYGHGLWPVAQTLLNCGCPSLCVGLPWEGKLLRDQGVDCAIFCLMGCVDQHLICLDYDLIPVINNFDDLCFFAECGENFQVALKFDSGMHRLGFGTEHIPALLHYLTGFGGALHIRWLFSHLACQDNPSLELNTAAQVTKIEFFRKLLNQYYPGLRISYGNSSSLCLALRDKVKIKRNICRPGLAIYGYAPFSEPTDLKPVMSIDAQVIGVKDIKKGDKVSYGASYEAPADTRIAIAQIGYANGISRRASDKISVYFNGKSYKQIGAICMSMLMLDIGEDNIKEGDIVQIVGPDAMNLTTFSNLTDRIPYESMCIFGMMNKRDYKGITDPAAIKTVEYLRSQGYPIYEKDCAAGAALNCDLPAADASGR